MAKTNPIPEIISEQLINRFWSKVEVGTGDDCWRWRGSVNNEGYGRFHIKRYPYLAHRVSYYLTHGALSTELHCLHKCDNPRCVNPSHLFLGSQKMNMDDMIAKGRIALNDRHPFTKLSDEQVREIKQGVTGGTPQKQYAALFHVSKALISAIMRGKNRRRVV